MSNNKREVSAGAEEKYQRKLRKLVRKARKLKSKMNSEIDRIKRETIKKGLRLNKKAELIIQGIDKLDASILQGSGEVFMQNDEKLSQSTQPCNATSVRNDGIEDYWKKVLKDTYAESMESFDLELLKYLKQISVKQYESQKTTIEFHIAPGHKIVDQGVYTRTLSVNGSIEHYEGNEVPKYSQMEHGFMKIILTSQINYNPLAEEVHIPGKIESDELEYIKNLDEIQNFQLECIGQFFQMLATELVPRSLVHYLKARLNQGLQVEPRYE